MNIFKLEEYLTRYEFTAPYLLCCSDAESVGLQDVLAMANAEEKALWDDLRLGYTEVKGLPRLREQIVASLYPGLHADDILCFAGAEEGIFCALSALCGPGDHVIALVPCYQSLAEVPRSRGADVACVALREENEWRIDFEAIKRALRPHTRGIIINFPHNPTGQVITPEELRELVALCERHDLWLLSDEVYRLLGQPRAPWAPSATELYPKALSIGVMSKAFGMPGLRVGWIACRERGLLQKITYVKHYTSICNSASSEILSLIALRNTDSVLARNNQIVAENLALLDAFMAKRQDLFSWVRPQGGCVGFVRYKGKESVDAFTERLVQQKGVLLMPGSIYDHDGPHFRIGFGRKNMPEVLGHLEEFLGL
jgi:aspartate/methionine/tyrosine aminotransferase